jgi:hypothetical protein
MTDAAPFEAGYLPIPGLTASEIAKSLALSPAEVTALLDATQRKLTQRRATRLLPRDTKVLAAWNGLALTALVQAARELDDAGYRASAQSLREELLRTLWDGKALKRSVSAGQAVGAVALEDYAYVAEGLLAYAQSSGKSEDYALARRVTEAAWTRLYGEGGFRLSEKNLLGAQGGQRLMADGPMSSPSAVLLRVSLVLADQLKDQPLKTRALAALNSGYTALEAEPFWHVTHVDTMRAAVGNP